MPREERREQMFPRCAACGDRDARVVDTPIGYRSLKIRLHPVCWESRAKNYAHYDRDVILAGTTVLCKNCFKPVDELGARRWSVQ